MISNFLSKMEFGKVKESVHKLFCIWMLLLVVVGKIIRDCMNWGVPYLFGGPWEWWCEWRCHCWWNWLDVVYAVVCGCCWPYTIVLMGVCWFGGCRWYCCWSCGSCDCCDCCGFDCDWCDHNQNSWLYIKYQSGIDLLRMNHLFLIFYTKKHTGICKTRNINNITMI